MKPIISVEGLGKSYTIRHEGQTRYRALREEIFKLPQRLLRRNGQSREEFWALKDVSFDVMPGERVGIIGRNGAGKSTLLKLLSRITEPTTGRITLRGRVASLLEVGTGFHPELTGRENIFLNGAILGMSRAEVRKKFDAIVDFAGVEKFLDTPVKRYSSGMYVRLAFAVAAHLEPEILVVDEVLAVGDAEFQKKCLGKMEDVGRSGRTVLFVSHNMAAIQGLCSRGILLHRGTVHLDGPAIQATNAYAAMVANTASCDRYGFFDHSRRTNPHNNGIPVIRGVSLHGPDGSPTNAFTMGKPASIAFHFDGLGAHPNAHVGVSFFTPEGQRITATATWLYKEAFAGDSRDVSEARLIIDAIPFTPGNIYASATVADHSARRIIDFIESAATFSVLEHDITGSGTYLSREYGATYLTARWVTGSPPNAPSHGISVDYGQEV